MGESNGSGALQVLQPQVRYSAALEEVVLRGVRGKKSKAPRALEVSTSKLRIPDPLERDFVDVEIIRVYLRDPELFEISGREDGEDPRLSIEVHKPEPPHYRDRGYEISFHFWGRRHLKPWISPNITERSPTWGNIILTLSQARKLRDVLAKFIADVEDVDVQETQT